MKKLNILLFISICSFSQGVPPEKLKEATVKWTHYNDGNPIDGFKKTAFRVSDNFEEGFLILKVENKGNNLTIENSSLGDGDNRDDIIINLRISEKIDDLEQVLIYFDNEKYYYGLNYRRYGSNGLSMWNAISNDDSKILTKFNFIWELINKNKLSLRFIFKNEIKNYKIGLNNSAYAISKVINLANIELNDDYKFDEVFGVLRMGALAASSEYTSTYGPHTIEKFVEVLTRYLTPKLGNYMLNKIGRLEIEKGEYINNEPFDKVIVYGFDNNIIHKSISILGMKKLNYAYEYAIDEGYKHSYEDFVELLSSNKEAFDLIYKKIKEKNPLTNRKDLAKDFGINLPKIYRDAEN